MSPGPYCTHWRSRLPCALSPIRHWLELVVAEEDRGSGAIPRICPKPRGKYPRTQLYLWLGSPSPLHDAFCYKGPPLLACLHDPRSRVRLARDHPSQHSIVTRRLLLQHLVLIGIARQEPTGAARNAIRSTARYPTSPTFQDLNSHSITVEQDTGIFCVFWRFGW